MGKGARNRARRAGMPPKPQKIGTPFEDRSKTKRRESYLNSLLNSQLLRMFGPR